MANHGQHLEFSTDVHKLFGYSLMLAALARIVEVCFVLRDQATSESGRPRAWQHLPPYLLILSGVSCHLAFSTFATPDGHRAAADVSLFLSGSVLYS